MRFQMVQEDSVRRRWFGIAAGLLAQTVFSAAASRAAETPPRSIVLAVAPVASAWRSAMMESWQRVTTAAIQDGMVAAAPVHMAMRNTLAAEAEQLTALVAERPPAIVIDAGSPQALNVVVRQACAAGIVVVSFDGIVTEPCAYRVKFDFRKLGATEVEALAQRLPAGGRLLEMRGIENTDLDDAIGDGVATAIAGRPALRIVGEVHGNWRRGDAMQNVASVLAVLPKVDGVLTQGGDALGVADAFTAAGRPMPVIILGNRAEELAWWKKQRDATGYQTFSVAPSPGIAGLAFWVAQRVLAGADVPHEVTAPFLTVEPGDLDQALAATPAGAFYSRDYTQADAAIAASR